MNQCVNGTFFSYFKENMEDLGLPVPSSLFATQVHALATITAITSVVAKFGTGVTVAELAIAGTALEQLSVVGACSASFYIGAAIGSTAVAAVRKASCGETLGGMIYNWVHRYQWELPWLRAHLRQHPEVLDFTRPHRQRYGQLARIQRRTPPPHRPGIQTLPYARSR